MRFVLDGRLLATAEHPFRVEWSLAPGVHELVVEGDDGRRSDSVSFSVNE